MLVKAECLSRQAQGNSTLRPLTTCILLGSGLSYTYTGCLRPSAKGEGFRSVATLKSVLTHFALILGSKWQTLKQEYSFMDPCLQLPLAGYHT